MLPCSVRTSGSESLPGVEAPDSEAYEDVSTCAVTDFPVLDSIPEQAPLDGKFLFPFIRVMSSSDARFFCLESLSLASALICGFLFARCGL